MLFSNGMPRLTDALENASTEEKKRTISKEILRNLQLAETIKSDKRFDYVVGGLNAQRRCLIHTTDPETQKSLSTDLATALTDSHVLQPLAARDAKGSFYRETLTRTVNQFNSCMILSDEDATKTVVAKNILRLLTSTDVQNGFTENWEKYKFLQSGREALISGLDSVEDTASKLQMCEIFYKLTTDAHLSEYFDANVHAHEFIHGNQDILIEALATATDPQVLYALSDHVALLAVDQNVHDIFTQRSLPRKRFVTKGFDAILNAYEKATDPRDKAHHQINLGQIAANCHCAPHLDEDHLRRGGFLQPDATMDLRELATQMKVMDAFLQNKDETVVDSYRATTALLVNDMQNTLTRMRDTPDFANNFVSRGEAEKLYANIQVLRNTPFYKFTLTT